MLVGKIKTPEEKAAEAEFSKTVRSGEVDPLQLTLEDESAWLPPSFRRKHEPGEW